MTCLLPVASGSSQVLTALWRVGLVEKDLFSHSIQHRGTPAASAGMNMVVVGDSSGNVTCFRSSNGRVVWRRKLGDPTDVPMLVQGNRVYAASLAGDVVAYRLADGKPLWRATLPGPVETKPVLAGNRLLMLTSNDRLVCLEKDTGKWLWNYQRGSPSDRFKIQGGARPLVAQDAVFAGFSDGYLVKLSLKDGTVLKSSRLASFDDMFYDVDVDPILAGGLVITGTASGGVMALDPETLETKWRVKMEAPSDIASDGDRLYLTDGKGTIWCLNAGNGTRVWAVRPRQDGLLSTPVKAGKWLLVSSEDVSLIVVDSTNGEIRQVFDPGKGSSAPAAVVGNRVFWVSNGETIFAFLLR